MNQYTSIHSGVDIDRAVSYYKSIDAYGRTILSVSVTTEDWIEINDEDRNNGLGILFDEKLVNETNIYTKKANNYIKIKLTGTYKLGGAPLVYFVDNNGQQWYTDHIFTPTKTGEEFDPTNIQEIYCLSNISMNGAVIITCNLTDINFAITNDQGEFINQSPISVELDKQDSLW